MLFASLIMTFFFKSIHKETKILQQIDSLVPRLSLFFFQLYKFVELIYQLQNSFIALERKEKAWYPKLTANMTSLECGCWNFGG